MLQRADFGEGFLGWCKMFVFLTNFVAWVLLLFNLIPMFPLDGGRILQAILWGRIGYTRSMRIACRAGIVGAVAIGIGALISESTMLLGIAIFGGFVCVASGRHIESQRDFLGFEPDPSEARRHGGSRGRTRHAFAAEDRRAREAKAEPGRG